MRARLEDVATRAGVSLATVSRVVNGKPGVSERTRRSVLAQAELLGYDRPRRARPRSGLVGLIVPELNNPIFPLFVQETERALAAQGFTPLLCTATPIVEENEYVGMLLERDVTAVVCGNDLMALGAIRAVRARGLRVPEDASVVGYDDSPLLAFTAPPLTTMRQDVAAMSRHAVDALVDEIHDRPQPRRELLFHAQLVVRKSTAPARVRST